MLFADGLKLPSGFRRREFFVRNFATRRDLYIHHDSVRARGDGKGSILYVRSFLAKDRAKQSFFRGQFCLAFRCDFSNQDITWFHFGSDPHDAIRAEIAQSFFADIGNIPRTFLRSELAITSTALKFIDVDGSINVFLHHLLGDHDGVFEVVSIPRHERDEHIASQRKLPVIGVWAVGDDLTAFHVLAFAHDRLLVHTRAGV